jgi:hypothetical protein
VTWQSIALDDSNHRRLAGTPAALVRATLIRAIALARLAAAAGFRTGPSGCSRLPHDRVLQAARDGIAGKPAIGTLLTRAGLARRAT